MQRNLSLVWIVVVLALTAGVVSFVRPAGSSASRTNVFRLALPTDVHSLDSAIAYEVDSWPLVRLVNQGLLDYDQGTELRPWLARELPQVSPDGRTITFRLREGIKFSNGRELVADDFVYTLERLLDPATKSPGEGFFRNIRGAKAFQEARTKDGDAARAKGEKAVRKTEPTRVDGLKAVDSHTFQITLEAPDLAFLHVMAMPFAYVVAREQVEKWGENYHQHPIGTGPYVLQEWRRSTRIVYAPNPHYDSARPDAPKLAGVEALIGADEILQLMMFERGELDYLAAIPDPDFVRITTSPRWKQSVVSMPTCATRYLSLNTEMEPFNDLRVRQAVCHALNKERLLTIIKGQGVAARTVLPPNMVGYSPNHRNYEYNPGKARALLAAAGKAEGLAVSLWLSIDDNRNVRIGQAVQQDLREIGIKVDLKPVAGTIFQDAAGRRKNMAFGLQAWYQDYPDPSNFLDVLLNGERIVEVHSNNKAFYSNPQVNALLKRAAVATNPGLRLSLYQQAEKQVLEDAPWACLYHPKVYMMRQPWLHGLEPNPVWPVRYERLWIERS